MKLAEITATPKLIKITLDDEAIIEQYGEELEFYTWDRQPMEKYLGLVGTEMNAENMPALIAFCKTMILDERGEAIMQGDEILPSYVMSLAINRVVTNLGKS
jgi:hypothetical protein